MSLTQFLVVSGVVGWCWVAWQAYGFLRGLPQRISWALWGHKRPARFTRWR